MDYNSIEEEIRAALGGRAAFSSTRITRALNLAQMRIARKKRWEELDSTSTGFLSFTGDASVDKFVSIPSNTRDIYTFRILTSDITDSLAVNASGGATSLTTVGSGKFGAGMDISITLDDGTSHQTSVVSCVGTTLTIASALPGSGVVASAGKAITYGGDGQSRKLTRRTPRWFDRNIPDISYYDRNTPTDYTRFSEKLEIWRLPDLAYAYSIRRCAWPTDFVGVVSGTQVSDLHQKDDMLIALSVSWILQSLGRIEDANQWWQTYTEMLKGAASEDLEKPDQLIAPDWERSDIAIASKYWANPFFTG